MALISTTAMENNWINYDYANYYNEGDTRGNLCDNSNMDGFRQLFLPILYSLVFIVGFIGNGLVVCIFVKHRSQINVTDICLLNLAISDLFFVLSLPFYTHTAFVDNWIFGAFMCHLITGLYIVGFYGGIFSVVAMTLDRYVVIMHAHTLARHRHYRFGVAVTALVWVLSLCISLPSVAITQLKNDSSVWQCDFLSETITLRHFQILSNNIFGLVIPLLVMIICYSRILPSLMAMKSTKKHRAIKLVVIIVVVFFLFWSPYNVALFLLFYRDKTENFITDCDTNLQISIQVTEAIAFTHCCLNPIIYAFVGQKFARRARGLLHAWLPFVFRNAGRDGGSSSKSSEATSTFTM